MAAQAANANSRLRAVSSVGDALFTIANLELDFAVGQLATPSSDSHEAIHQCRKAIKRLRAIARLGVAVPGADPQSIDRRLRDAGRLLAPARDATVVANALARLIDAEPELDKLEHIERLREWNSSVEPPVDAVLAELATVRSRLPVLFESPDEWTVARIVAGIEAAYVAASTRMRRLERTNNSRRAHAWRKSVQRLFHELGTIEALCPDFLGRILGQLNELADLLGDHHDLAVLNERLNNRDQRIPEKTLSAVAAASRSRQEHLRQCAISTASDCFAQRPQAFRDALLDACTAAEPEARPTYDD